MQMAIDMKDNGIFSFNIKNVFLNTIKGKMIWNQTKEFILMKCLNIKVNSKMT